MSEVVPGALARELTAVADGLSEQVASPLPDNALGEVGQSFTALLDQLVAAGNRALASGVRAMNATADGVADSRDALARHESETGGVGG